MQPIEQAIEGGKSGAPVEDAIKAGRPARKCLLCLFPIRYTVNSSPCRV